MKLLHTFSIDQEIEEEKEVTRKKRGSKEEVTTTKLVKSNVPVNIQVRKPNRRQLEDAELEYSVEMSRCIKKGILTKAMLSNKYSDTGGLFSEEDATLYADLYKQLLELQSEYTQLDVATKKNQKQKDRFEEIKTELAGLRREIVGMEGRFQSLFDHTAESKAQNKLLLWYTLNLTFIEEEEDKFVPYFEGDTFEEKQEDFYDKEEEGSDFYHQLGGKVSTVFAFWFYNQASSEEEFKELLEKVDKGEV